MLTLETNKTPKLKPQLPPASTSDAVIHDIAEQNIAAASMATLFGRVSIIPGRATGNIFSWPQQPIHPSPPHDPLSLGVNVALRSVEINTLHPEPKHTQAEKQKISNKKTGLIKLNQMDKVGLTEVISAINRDERDAVISDWLRVLAPNLASRKHIIHLSKVINGIGTEITLAESIEQLYGYRYRKATLAEDRLQATDLILMHPKGLAIRLDAKSPSSLRVLTDKGRAKPLNETTAIGNKKLTLVGGFTAFNVPILYAAPAIAPHQIEVDTVRGKIHFNSQSSPPLKSELINLREGCERFIELYPTSVRELCLAESAELVTV